MYLSRLEVTDYRGYARADLRLEPGVSTLLGRNGQGKTNLVEAVGYVAFLASHRVAQDAPLIRHGADSAVIRATVRRDGRESLVELEIRTGRANRARLNRSPMSRQRDVLGTLRTVLFAPEDLALVKGDPGERRRLLDDLLVARQPRWSAVRQDYDKALKQRNALLKSVRSQTRPPGGARGAPADPGATESAEATMAVFDAHLAQIGAALTYARLRLLRDLGPYLAQAYASISEADTPARAQYRSCLHEEVAAAIGSGTVPSQEELRAASLATMDQRRQTERERGISLVGPHRDDVLLSLGEIPAKGYASHGECWSIALALRLASFELLRHDLGTDPVLILDDVFAELDSGRRGRLAQMVRDCEQVLLTAAVPQDVPADLVRGAVFDVVDQSIRPRTDPAP